MLPTRSPLLRLWRNASRVRSPIASRSHWLTAPMMVITRRPAAELVSSDSATEISATLRFSNNSSKLHRSLTLRVSRSGLATMIVWTLGTLPRQRPVNASLRSRQLSEQL